MNFGDALADRGKLDEAMKHYRKALGLASARNEKDMVEAIRAVIQRRQQAAPAGHGP